MKFEFKMDQIGLKHLLVSIILKNGETMNSSLDYDNGLMRK